MPQGNGMPRRWILEVIDSNGDACGGKKPNVSIDWYTLSSPARRFNARRAKSHNPD
jgi:hypothetical protein